MDNKKIKLRRCIVCGEYKQKEDLIRIVKDKEGNISIDETGKMNGRGAYICKDKASIEKAISQRLLNKSLKCNIPNEILEDLRSM